MTIGHPRPLPGYPTESALYPVPVRRVRVLASASFRSRLATGTLAEPRGSGHHGPQRTCTSESHNMPGAQQGLEVRLRGLQSIFIKPRSVDALSGPTLRQPKFLEGLDNRCTKDQLPMLRPIGTFLLEHYQDREPRLGVAAQMFA